MDRVMLIAVWVMLSTIPGARAAIGMTLEVKGAKDGGSAAADMAYCVPSLSGHVQLGANRSPGLQWSAPPAGSKSVAILMFDDDVPSDTGRVNKEGEHIEARAPRHRFYHWAFTDLSPQTRSLRAGEGGSGVVPRGRPSSGGRGRAAVNDYTGFFSGDAVMAGRYRGYDGPCPPWNDTATHRYAIRVLALDVERIPLPDDFTGSQFERAAEGHIVDSASTTLTFSTMQSLPH